jgi:phosphatidylserine/phosphatidylglycerophosphate/cardiolipin synthase-like enzyme
VALEHAVATPHYQDAVRDLREAWARQPLVDSAALALALECAAERQQAARRRRVSIVWTGPPTEAVPVRRTDQALLELVNAAKQRLIVVSFAVYKVPAIAEALVAAASRGVSVAVVLESEGVLEGVERLVVVTGDQDLALLRQETEEARLQQREVLVLVDDDQWVARDRILVVGQVREDPMHEVGVRDRVLVVAELQRVGDDAVAVVEVVQAPLDVVLADALAAEQVQIGRQITSMSPE